MALARVVQFDGVGQERIDEMQRNINEGDRPEGLDATEILVLHDATAEQALAIVFFEDEDAYARGDEILSAMPASDTPGQRTSVKKYNVALRRTP